MDKLLTGKNVAEKIMSEVLADIKKLKNQNINPSLAIVQVGENPDSTAYLNSAAKRMEKADIKVQTYTFAEDISEDEFLSVFEVINNDKNIHGILLLQPLPNQISLKNVERIFNPLKDIDGMCTNNMGKVFSGAHDGFAPCTPTAVMELIDDYAIETEGKHAVIIGRSLVVGKPLSMLLLNKNATVTVCSSYTKNLSAITSNADIVIAAVGKAKMVTSDYIKEGAVVIDVGINFDENGNLCGDVDFDNVFEKSCAITPVPRGIGGITTSVLAKHVVKAAKLLNQPL